MILREPLVRHEDGEEARIPFVQKALFLQFLVVQRGTTHRDEITDFQHPHPWRLAVLGMVRTSNINSTVSEGEITKEHPKFERKLQNITQAHACNPLRSDPHIAHNTPTQRKIHSLWVLHRKPTYAD